IVVAGTRDPYAVLAFGFGAFALVANAAEFWTGTRARRRATGEAWPVALVKLVRANRHRYGGYLAHIGLVSIAVGVAASSTFRRDVEATVRPGEAVALGSFSVRFDRVWGREEPQRFVIGADLTVFQDGREVGRLEPRLNFDRSSEQPITTPAVRSRASGALYVNLLAFERDGSTATLQVLLEPLVPWLWIGGGIIVLGALIAAWPESRRRRPIREAASPVRRAAPFTGAPDERAADAVVAGGVEPGAGGRLRCYWAWSCSGAGPRPRARRSRRIRSRRPTRRWRRPCGRSRLRSGALSVRGFPLRTRTRTWPAK